MDSRRSMVGVLAGGGILALAIGMFFLFGGPGSGPVPEVSGPEVQRPESAAAATAPPIERRAEPRVATPAQAAPPAATGEPEDERMRKTRFGLKGRVLDAGRQSVADMAVELFLMEQAMFMPSLDTLCSEPQVPPLRAGKTRTDASGRFFLERLPSRRPGLLSLGVHTAQATFRILDRTPEPGETLDLGDIVLAESTTLSGTVVDDAGAPVAGARVRVADFPAIAFTAGAAWFHGDGGLLIQDRGSSRTDRQVFPFAKWMSELEKDMPLPETFTDESGQFSLVRMPAGKPSLWIQKRGLIPLQHGPVSAEPGKERNLGRLVLQRGESVTGMVVDGAGAGVAGAEVLVGAPAMGGFPLTFLRPVGPTDPSGRFTIDATGRDKLMLVARRGPAEVWVVEGPVDPGDDLVIKLEEPGLLRVFVADERGATVDGVELRLVPDHEMFQIANMLPPLPLAQRTKRAEDGSYLMRNLKLGKLKVQARKAGYIPAEGKVELTGATESQLRLVLGPAAEGRVRVEDPAGLPVAHARIYVKGETLGKGFLRGGIPVQIGMTERNGEALLREVPAGTHTAWVMHPEFGNARFTLLLPGPVVVVRMLQTGAIAGVLTRGGQPCPDSYAVALSRDWQERNPADEIPTLAWTQPDGTFRFGAVVPGRHRIHVQARLSAGGTMNDVVRIIQSMDDLWGNSTEATVVAGQECRVQLDIKVEDPSQVGRVTGVVMRNGRPAEGLTVHAWSGKSQRGTTDAAGRFELTGVRAGRDIWLNVSEPPEKGGDHRQIAQRNVQVKAGETVEIRIEVTTGHLRGRALLADGAPAAETTINLQGQADGAEKNQGWVHYSAVTDAAGDFAVRDLVAGSYTLSVQKEGFVLANEAKAKVRPSEETSGVILRVIKACQLGGRVVAEGGLTASTRYWVMLRPKDSSPQDTFRSWARVNAADGRFDPVDIAPGSYTATLQGGPEIYRPNDVTVTGTRLDAVLEFSKAPPQPAQQGK